MIVLCILLAMLSLFCSETDLSAETGSENQKKQIDFLTDRDTQTEIMVEKRMGQYRIWLQVSIIFSKNIAV